MEFWAIVWQILGYGALAAIVIVVIFAIIEPGPLQQHRGFGGRDQVELDQDPVPMDRAQHRQKEEREQ